MLTIYELQAADYFIKKFLNDKDFPFHNKDLKFVIEVNNQFWYGDFVNFNSGTIEQRFIDNGGEVELMRFSSDSQSATSLLKKVRDTYAHEVEKTFYNPFRQIDELPILFETIFKLITLADIQPEDSPIRPHLLNAKSLDGKLELPFINLENQPIIVVSLIEVTIESE